MKFATYIKITLALLCLLGCSEVYAEPWMDAFAVKVRQDAKDKGIPGFIMVVVEPNKPNRYYTFGVTEKNGQRITKDTKFRLASVSKTFTAALMAKYQQLSPGYDWQTPITQLVPEYSFDNYSDKPVLLRHIIGQSTGFMPNAYDNLIEANYGRKRVLNELSKLKPICQPGYCYTYQNAFFGVLEEHFMQQNSSYAAQLQQHIFAPLQMDASVGKQALESSAEWAKPHAAVAKNKWVKVRVKDDYYRFSPAAGINASAEDMAKWMRAMLLENPEVISSQMVDEMTQPRVATKRELRRRGWRGKLTSAHYGLGWRVYHFQGVKLNYHGGWVQGYRADVSFSPELNIGFAFLMNAESNLINTSTPDFWTRAVTNRSSD
ncbi:serine hydrolase domain-containing protein [Glaciecola sp. 1036]|uniref:serine hydrolase domain-containing protein n=1 Tax=Alteromonadaceae TaxID=72275 RepID=UPI003D05CF46